MELLIQSFGDRALGSGARLAAQDVLRGPARKALCDLKPKERAELHAQLGFNLFPVIRDGFQVARFR